MHQRCMTKYFVSSLALFALCTALGGCSSDEPSDSEDRDDVDAEDRDGRDSSAPDDDSVEPGNALDGGPTSADGGAARDARGASPAERDARSDDDDDDDDDSDDDSDEDDDDDAADAAARDAGRADASADAGARDGGSTRDSSIAQDASTARDSGSNAQPQPGNLTRTVVNETIVVTAGMTFDGTGKRFVANPDPLGDGSQKEGQKPVFKLENGAKLVNVTLGAPAADGIHTHGNVVLENIVWEDIGEDAMTIKEKGTVELRGGSATKGEDKVFQINAESTFRVSNFKASDAGKFIRQNGETTFKVQVFIDRCDISNMDEAIFRTDSNSSTVSLTNTRYSNIGDALFVGVNSANITQMNNTEY